MGDRFKKVSAGEPLAISAEVHNATLDAIRALKAGRHDQLAEALVTSRDGDIVTVRNETCLDLDRCSVLGIDRPIFTPATAEREFKNHVRLRTSLPSIARHTGRFVVLLDPVARCKLGRAFASGVCPVKVDVSNSRHAFADVADGETGWLASGTIGAAQILWREGGEGVQWCVVRLANPRTAVAPTTTTTAPLLQTAECTGYCKFMADAFLQWQLDADYCGLAPPPTTTSGAPTTTTTPCCDFDAATTTTTTAGPTTTTTPESCDCLWPTFCPTAEGQCTYTQCAKGVTNSPPDCGPTTTTSCDCSTVEPPPGCDEDCDWIHFGQWVLLRNGCPGLISECRCSAPRTVPPADSCTIVSTNCTLPPPDHASCDGECRFKWIGALGVFVWGGGDCGDFIDCGCVPPSAPPCAADECCDVTVPCVAPPSTTTTLYSHCQHVCYGETTTTTAEPIATCATGGCVFTANGTTGWNGPYSDDCPPACPCAEPPRLPLDTCELYRGRCVTTPPTTTTTLGPTTTTTAVPTTTSTSPPTTTTTVAPTTTTTQGSCSGTATWQWTAGSPGCWVLITNNCDGSSEFCDMGLYCNPAYPTCAGTIDGETIDTDCVCRDGFFTSWCPPPCTTTSVPPTTTTTTAPLGACCRAAAGCYVTDEYNCLHAQIPGTWMGPGTSCDPDCLGACCDPFGNCNQTEQSDCNMVGGWQGLGVPCSPNPCGAPSTTTSASTCGSANCTYIWAAPPGMWVYVNNGSCDVAGSCMCCPPTYPGTMNGEYGLGTCQPDGSC